MFFAFTCLMSIFDDFLNFVGNFFIIMKTNWGYFVENQGTFYIVACEGLSMNNAT